MEEIPPPKKDNRRKQLLVFPLQSIGDCWRERWEAGTGVRPLYQENGRKFNETSLSNFGRKK